tara:strand:+ start:771 stop:1778 length:1008 start_codon:yes stop_codon:yes gene_type:complete
MNSQMQLRQPLLILSVVLVIGISAVSIIYYNQINEISTLSDQKTELESSKADLMEQLVELEADLIAISGTIIDLEAQLKDLETENIKINDDIEKKKSENQNLIGDISSREKTIMILETELVEAKTQLSEFGEQIEQLLVEIENLESQAAIPAAPPASEEAPPASEEAPPASEEETLANDEVIGGHLDPLIMATLNCEECHTKVTEQAFAEESNIYHNAMLNNNLLNFSCADCHKSVDILSESEDLSRVIDNATCVKCHTAFPDKQWMQSISNAKSFANLFPDCQECHGDWKSRMDDATFVNIDVITNSDCRTCHVDNVLFDVEKERITLSCGNCH